MRFAKKNLGKFQEYTVKDASTFEQQKAETKKLNKVDKSSDKKEKPKRVRKKNGFEDALKQVMKSTEVKAKKEKKKAKKDS